MSIYRCNSYAELSSNLKHATTVWTPARPGINIPVAEFTIFGLDDLDIHPAELNNVLDIPSIEFRCAGFGHDATVHRGVRRQTGRILLCAVLLAFTGTAVAETDLEAVIPDDIRVAYKSIGLTEAQVGSFDPLMLDAINEIKSMLKKEGLKARWPFERRIRVKANFILERHAPALRDTLEQHQIPAFEEYTALVLETMTSLSPKEYEGVAFGPVIGVIERGD